MTADTMYFSGKVMEVRDNEIHIEFLRPLPDDPTDTDCFKFESIWIPRPDIPVKEFQKIELAIKLTTP